jgi:dTDP-4-amino-4,6-dideoxygalactose transaminase
VFVDVREDTLNLDERLIERAITSKTRAIVPVHYAGVSCEMPAIMDTAARHGLTVVEDAAQGVGAYHRSRALGSIGHLGCFSFHATKNYACGEGGALCINDHALIERAEILREKGTNRKQFLRGQVDKYTWTEIGSSFLPSEIACAFLCAQLEALREINQLRGRIHALYRHRLQPLEDAGLVRLPHVPEHCRHNHHLFYLLLSDGVSRDALISHLAARGIQATFHYIPLHDSPVGASFGSRCGDLPVTECISARLVRLPLHAAMSEHEAIHVARATADFLIERHRLQIARRSAA